MTRKIVAVVRGPCAGAKFDPTRDDPWVASTGEAGSSSTGLRAPVPNLAGQMSSPGLHYPGVGNQVPLKERVRLGEITDSSRTVTDRGSRLDDRPEDSLTGLLTETLIGHDRRR